MPRQAEVKKGEQKVAPRAGSRARTDTRGNKNELDTRRFEPKGREAHIALEGPAEIDRDDVEVVDGPRFKTAAEEAAFMEETLIIVVHNSAEKHPENPVYVAINGRGCYIFRGQKTIIRRKYVDRLARAAIDHVSQDVEAKTPEEVNKLTINTALRYPFSVLEDKNPLGAAWLQKILLSSGM